MDASLGIGKRVKRYRETAGRSQTVVAGLCGITERYLSMIESGQKTPSPKVLSLLAAELGVPVASLLSDSPGAEPAAAGRAAPDVVRTLMGYRRPSLNELAVSPVDLRERVEQAWSCWQTSKDRFSRAEETLPALVGDVEHALAARRRGSDAAERRDVLRIAADLYGLLRSYCRRVGRLDLSLMAADRAIRVAEEADDPVRLAGAQWNLGHVLLSDTRDGAAEEGDVLVKPGDAPRRPTNDEFRTAQVMPLESADWLLKTASRIEATFAEPKEAADWYTETVAVHAPTFAGTYGDAPGRAEIVRRLTAGEDVVGGWWVVGGRFLSVNLIACPHRIRTQYACPAP